jgi:hypothetical protein
VLVNPLANPYSGGMATLRDMLSGEPDMAAIEAHLDGLDASARIGAIRSLGARHEAALFDAAKGHRPLSLTDVVPDDRPPLTGVRHEGKNSLPVFSTFAKIFCRPDRATDRDERWGYNANPALIESFVGPGYFVAIAGEAPGEVLIDYQRIPPAKPDDWPALRPNDEGLSRLVFGGMQDVLRGVSQHVSIGRAFKKGNAMDAWFVLCREA